MINLVIYTIGFFSGDLLMNAGFALDLNKEYDSWVLELTEVK